MSASNLERRVVWLAALIQLANVMDFMIILPLGPDLMKAINIPSSDMGYLGGAYTFAAAISGILFAPFLDRFDRKNAVIFFLCGLMISTFLCGLAFNTISMLGARLLAGLFGGPVTALSMSMVIDMVPIARRGRAIALVGGAFTISSVIGIPVALELARIGTWQLPFFAVAGIAGLIAFLSLCLLPAMTAHFEKEGEQKKRKPLLPMLKVHEVQLSYLMAGLLSFAQFMLFAGTINYYVFNLGFPRDDLSWVYAIAGALSFGVMLLTGRIVDRFGVRIPSIVTTILYALVLADGYLHVPIVGIPAVFTLFMMGAAIMSVITGSIASEVPRDHERAAYMSLQTTTKHVAAGTGSITAAIVLTTNADGSLNNIDILAVITIGCIIALPILIIKLRSQLNARISKG